MDSHFLATEVDPHESESLNTKTQCSSERTTYTFESRSHHQVFLDLKWKNQLKKKKRFPCALRKTSNTLIKRITDIIQKSRLSGSIMLHT